MNLLLCMQKFDENGLPEYLVRWEGCSSQEDQWEPLNNLKGCLPAVKHFDQRLRRCKKSHGLEPLYLPRATKSI